MQLTGMTEKCAHLRQVADQHGLQVDAAFCAMQLERIGIDDPRTVDPQLLASHMQTFQTMYRAHFGND